MFASEQIALYWEVVTLCDTYPALTERVASAALLGK